MIALISCLTAFSPRHTGDGEVVEHSSFRQSQMESMNATIPDAFDVLMNGYWRDVLISLGAVPVEKNTGLRGELINTLRKRLRRPKGDLTFSSGTELDRLARESIRFGRMAGKSDRFIDYATLHERWKALLDADLK